MQVGFRFSKKWIKLKPASLNKGKSKLVAEDLMLIHRINQPSIQVGICNHYIKDPKH